MKHSPLTIGMCAMGLVLLVGLVAIAAAHVHELGQVQQVSLPLAAELPPLEKRAKLLAEQIDLTEAEAAIRSGSPEEKLRAYVLPERADLARLPAFFDVT